MSKLSLSYRATFIVLTPPVLVRRFHLRRQERPGWLQAGSSQP